MIHRQGTRVAVRFVPYLAQILLHLGVSLSIHLPPGVKIPELTDGEKQAFRDLAAWLPPEGFQTSEVLHFFGQLESDFDTLALALTPEQTPIWFSCEATVKRHGDDDGSVCRKISSTEAMEACSRVSPNISFFLLPKTS